MCGLFRFTNHLFNDSFFIFLFVIFIDKRLTKRTSKDFASTDVPAHSDHAYSDIPVTVTLWPSSDGVTGGEHICIAVDFVHSTFFYCQANLRLAGHQQQVASSYRAGEGRTSTLLLHVSEIFN